MESHHQRCIAFVTAVLMFVATSSEARHFWIGGKDGWVLKPSEGYSHWSKRERFQVNDTLIFKFKEGSDSVLAVDKNAYYKCTKANPIQNLTSSHSEFQFPHSGHFYFISGEADNCLKGQKIEIVVMAVRHHHHNHATSPLAAVSPTQAWTVSAPAPAPSAAPKILSSCGLGVFLGLGAVFLFLGLF